MTLNRREAFQYILEHFNLSGEAQRMCDNLLGYIADHDPENARDLILTVFDAFGFDQEDLIILERDGVISGLD